MLPTGGSGDIVWTPTAERIARSTMTAFRRWLGERHGRTFSGYDELWGWSVDSLEEFWGCVWDYFELGGRGPTVLEQRVMPGARWFPGTTLNFAERALSHGGEAIVFEREDGASGQLSFAELRDAVGAAAQGLRNLGVEPGDRVAAVLPNCPEAIIAFLAVASIGAVWTSCAPEFGADGVVSRFAQVAPDILIAVDGYVYGGKRFETVNRALDIRDRLPTVREVVLVQSVEADVPEGIVAWSDLIRTPARIEIVRVPFDHPLWILYSSGTTGLPKAIVHGHGGIVVSGLKDQGIQLELTSGERLFRYTTPTWVMWNILATALLTGSTIVLYDGHPLYPDPGVLWRLAARHRVTNFGAGASWIEACMRAGVEPRDAGNLDALHTLAATGSPLPVEAYHWAYDHVGPDTHVASNCGGTDVCGPLLGSCALLPVRAGEIQCRPLGVRSEAWDDDGRAVVDEIGELVVVEPTPSMPLHLWGDEGGARLHESYFDRFDGVWRHGDRVRITPTGGAVVYGRSDATLNRGGVRMGTAEFYAVLAGIAGIRDAVVVDTSEAGAGGELLVLVALDDGCELDEGLVATIRSELRTRLSPRHVPNAILSIPDVPYTSTGKKCEVPVKRLLQGEPAAAVIAADSLRNPESLPGLVSVAESYRARQRVSRPA